MRDPPTIDIVIHSVLGVGPMRPKPFESSRIEAIAKAHSTYVSVRKCLVCAEAGQTEFVRYSSQGQCAACMIRRAKIQTKLKAKIKKDAFAVEQEQNEIAVLSLRRGRYPLGSISYTIADDQHLRYLLRKHKKELPTDDVSAAPVATNPWD